jgi:UDP-GlcNAc:undecaprenyl-phosphate/decaprenyl-phosphate GlcNAc-1-phosphate transferase
LHPLIIRMESYSQLFLIIFLVIYFFGAITFSFLINGLFLKFAGTLGIRKEAVIRWSNQKPAVGGFSFYIIFLLSITSFSIFFDTSHSLSNINSLGILVATTFSFVVGLADDAYNTKPLLKFIGQFLCGFFLIISGNYIQLTDYAALNYLMTLLWIIGIMNSINMLDNMDAISTVVSVLIITTAIIAQIILTIQPFLLITMIGVLASLLGFLYYNWHPSKIYMGDTGSQFLGCLLGIVGIHFFWNYDLTSTGYSVIFRNLILVAIVFIIPLCDTLTVVINRISKGKSPFVGGRDHTTHHLSYLGFSDRKVAWIFIIISFLSLLFIIFIMKFIKEWAFLHYLLFGCYILLVFTLLFMSTKIKSLRARQ